jgi:hypothetical protein
VCHGDHLGDDQRDGTACGIVEVVSVTFQTQLYGGEEQLVTVRGSICDIADTVVWWRRTIGHC